MVQNTDCKLARQPFVGNTFFRKNWCKFLHAVCRSCYQTNGAKAPKKTQSTGAKQKKNHPQASLLYLQVILL